MGCHIAISSSKNRPSMLVENVAGPKSGYHPKQRELPHVKESGRRERSCHEENHRGWSSFVVMLETFKGDLIVVVKLLESLY